MDKPKPGDIVIVERRVVVDVADYSDYEDGGIQDVFCVLRRPDDDPAREVDEDGGDVELTAVQASLLKVIGSIYDEDDNG